MVDNMFNQPQNPYNGVLLRQQGILNCMSNETEKAIQQESKCINQKRRGIGLLDNRHPGVLRFVSRDLTLPTCRRFF